jgi:outer membrane receptor protein involved in Fe transport
MKGYAEFAATTVLNWTNGANNEIRNRAIGYNNAFLSSVQPVYQSTIAAQRAANALGSFNFSRILSQTDAIPAPRNENRGAQYLFLASLEGSWRRNRWNVGYERAAAVANAFQPNNYSNPRLFAAMNAVVNPATNQIACNATLVNPAAYGGCVPLNLFGPTASNRAAYDYIRSPSQGATTNLLDDWSANITGAPFRTWAGAVDMALSADWRRQSYRVTSSALPTDPVDCSGIQFNCVSGGTSPTTPYANSSASFPKATLNVTEFAYEFQAPLLRDRRLARDLGLNGALRNTNYETSGTVWTWKLGVTWAPNTSLGLRAARSRDIRAPTLTNLFAPPTIAVSNITDIHTGVTGQVQTRSQGNPGLVPEEADTFTAGFVLTPQSIDGFSASMDYYHIRINKGLLGPAPTQPATQQVCEDSNGSSPVCELYIRPLPFSDHTAANFPVAIQNLTLNTAGLLAYGVDTEIDWVHPIAGHNLKLRLLLNYQPHLVYDLGPGGILDVGGAADGVGGLPATPNVKALLQVNYEVARNFTATVQERYRNALRQNGSTVLFFAFGKQPPTFYTDLTLNYKLKALDGNAETFLNVRNVFNKSPDPWASTGGTSQIGSFGGWLQGDDPLGRYYTIGVRYRR